MKTATETPEIALLVLDVHGVVFNSPLTGYLAEVAQRTDQPEGSVVARWHQELRRPTWLGELSEPELWRRLAGASGREDELRARFEARFRLGPAAPHLADWRRHVPVWLLSNHRSTWLHERLARFHLQDHFERILVSDRIGAPKPEPAAFTPLLQTGHAPHEILFVDDQQKNVDAARSLGLTAIHASDESDWLDSVARLVATAHDERRPRHRSA